ncbi:MAG: hypothetical protein OET90_00400 [Desulfuromonadales bacterium]|nr:hypothetical protein [Desulfuromonadales bacterium]
MSETNEKQPQPEEATETSPQLEQTEQTEQVEAQPEPSLADKRFPELAELEAKIQRRLRRNQLFLERFLDEDFEDLDDDEANAIDVDSPEPEEEL